MAEKRKKYRIMLVFGTRPEVIKLAPVVEELRRRSKSFTAVPCFTAQHRQMGEALLRFFKIEPAYDLNVMTENQSLADIAARTMARLDAVLARDRPDMILVQGDTASAFAAALIGFYRRIPVGHVEAGLRTGNRENPFPEEMNRQLIGRIADLHFAPTRGAARALAREGIPAGNVFVTGNTVIDALYLTLATMKLRRRNAARRPGGRRRGSRKGARVILVTAHRRESFGKGIEEICAALLELARRHDDIEIFLPVHPNPAVKKPIERALSGHPRITLSAPVEYTTLIRIMNESSIVLTDSGGLQEEAPALGIPVVVLRDVTERPEIVAAGGAVLAGPHRERIVSEVEKILADTSVARRMARVRNPFGDGLASKRIVRIIEARLRSPGSDIRAVRGDMEFRGAK